MSSSSVASTGHASAADRTQEFRAMVDARRRAEHLATGDTSSAPPAILAPVRKLTPFTESATHLRNSIRSLHEFLLSQKSEYLDLHRLVSTSSTLRRGRALTDADRDALEAEVSRSTVSINAKIDALKASIREEEPEEEEEDDEDDQDPTEKEDPAAREARKAAERALNNPDLRAHQHTLIILLVDSLRSLVQLMASWKSQRTERMKREMEEKHPGALKAYERRAAAAATAARADTSSHPSLASDSTPADGASSSDHFPAVLSKAVSLSLSSGLKKLGVSSGGDESKQPHSTFGPIDEQPPSSPAVHLTPLETAQLQEENHRLLDSLEEDLDQIKRAESKLSDISSLLSLFAVKVSEQEEQISTIYDHAIRSTLHVHSGIAELKKAAQAGVTFRMMILLMILMLSFSLLFLDWFMP